MKTDDDPTQAFPVLNGILFDTPDERHFVIGRKNTFYVNGGNLTGCQVRWISGSLDSNEPVVWHHIETLNCSLGDQIKVKAKPTLEGHDGRPLALGEITVIVTGPNGELAIGAFFVNYVGHRVEQ